MRVRILREVGGIGDLVRCTAVATAIKKQYPSAYIEMWTIAKYAPYARQCPDISKVVVLSEPVRERDSDWRKVYSPEGFDHTIDLYCPAFRYERAVAPFVDKDRIEIWTESAAEQSGLDLKPCKPVVSLSRECLRGGKVVARRCGFGYKGEREVPVVGMLTSNASGLRSFGGKQFVGIAKRLHEAGCRVFGIDQRYTPEELWGLVDQLDLLVCTDTGPMHMAGALDIPCVVVCSTTEGSLLTKWYDSVRYINVAFCEPATCAGHCYYASRREHLHWCLKNNQCDALKHFSPTLVAKAALEVLGGGGCEAEDNQPAHEASRNSKRTVSEDEVVGLVPLSQAGGV